jgi:hypothetical protein
MKLEFSRHFFFSKNAQISNLIESRPAGAELFHADGRTDRQTNLTVTCRKYPNASKYVTQIIKHAYSLLYQLHCEEHVFAESLKPSGNPIDITNLYRYSTRNFAES